MRNVNVCAQSIAQAIKSCNGQRITQEAAQSAMKDLIVKSKPDELADNMTCWLNLSALNQELERHGLVKTERAVPALIGAVKAELNKK